MGDSWLRSTSGVDMGEERALNVALQRSERRSSCGREYGKVGGRTECWVVDNIERDSVAPVEACLYRSASGHVLEIDLADVHRLV